MLWVSHHPYSREHFLILPRRHIHSFAHHASTNHFMVAARANYLGPWFWYYLSQLHFQPELNTPELEEA